MQEQIRGVPHSLKLEDRKKLTMTGVPEVLSFDEETVVVKTAAGTLTVRGSGLRLKNLSPEGGQVEINGVIADLSYQEPKAAGGWLRRLLG